MIKVYESLEPPLLRAVTKEARRSGLAVIRNTRKIAKVFQAGREVKLDYSSDYSIPIPDPLRMELESSSYYPVPAISEVSPKAVREGGPDLELKIQGVGFLPQSRVEMDGIGVATEFVDTRTLKARIPADRLAGVGTRALQVRNPAPGGGVSEDYGLIVFFAKEQKKGSAVASPY